MPEIIRAKRTRVEPEGFLEGVPNRSLTEEDWQALDVEHRNKVRLSGLYDVKTNDSVHAELHADDSTAAISTEALQEAAPDAFPAREPEPEPVADQAA